MAGSRQRSTGRETERTPLARRDPVRLSLRVDLGGGHRLGPGKVRLLELIDEHGSISAAGRAMAMSYRRAWLLVESINATFTSPAVSTQRGGTAGGGAALTPFGRDVVRRYRQMETLAAQAAAEHLQALRSARSPEPAPEGAPAAPGR